MTLLLFSFEHFEYIGLCLLACTVSNEKCAGSLIEGPLDVGIRFSLAAFKILWLSITLWSFVIMCLSVGLFDFLILGVP